VLRPRRLRWAPARRAAGQAENPAPAWSLAAALLGFFAVTLDAVIVNVALPDIRRELSAMTVAKQVLGDRRDDQ
jgi:MFS transporter, DHA2 family, methylenomycin A resistance protein